MTYHPLPDVAGEWGYPHSRKIDFFDLWFKLVRRDHSSNYEEMIDIQAKNYKDFIELTIIVQRWWGSSGGSLEEVTLWRRLKRISLGGVHRDGEQLLFDWV